MGTLTNMLINNIMNTDTNGLHIRPSDELYNKHSNRNVVDNLMNAKTDTLMYSLLNILTKHYSKQIDLNWS